MATNTTPVTLKATQMMGRPITWAQINLRASEDLRGLIKRAPRAAELMLALIERMQPGAGGIVVVSRTTMSEILGSSLRTIDRSVDVLASEGWVQKMRIGGAFALAINCRVAWIGPRETISHAAFAATVIASRSEQDALALAPPPIRYVPMVQPGDEPYADGPGLEPPSQPELGGMPPVAAVAGGRIDPETGEILRLP